MTLERLKSPGHVSGRSLPGKRSWPAHSEKFLIHLIGGDLRPLHFITAHRVTSLAGFVLVELQTTPLRTWAICALRLRDSCRAFESISAITSDGTVTQTRENSDFNFDFMLGIQPAYL
jgi:hypothetical protein